MSTSVSIPVRDISVAHSPDSDDAFMFYGLATNKVRVPGLKFNHTLMDIETLNRKAMDGVYDVTAISFHAYPYIQDRYALMPCGGSVGERSLLFESASGRSPRKSPGAGRVSLSRSFVRISAP